MLFLEELYSWIHAAPGWRISKHIQFELESASVHIRREPCAGVLATTSGRNLEPNTIDIIVREGLGQSAVTAIESMYGCGIKDCGMLTLLKLAEVAEQLIMEELLSDIAEALNACQISNEELYYYFNKLLFIEKIQ